MDLRWFNKKTYKTMRERKENRGKNRKMKKEGGLV